MARPTGSEKQDNCASSSKGGGVDKSIMNPKGMGRDVKRGGDEQAACKTTNLRKKTHTTPGKSRGRP